MVPLEGFASKCVPDQVSMIPVLLTAFLIPQYIKELLTRRQLYEIQLRLVRLPIIEIYAFQVKNVELFLVWADGTQ